MGLSGKKVVKLDIKFPGDVLHGLFRYKLADLLIIAPEYLKTCELQEGEWGAVGSIIKWDYVLDGKKQGLKHNIEAVDEINKLITFNIFDGDLMRVYKSFKAHVQVEGTGDSSTVTWTLEYEKMNEDVPDPDSIVEVAHNVTKYVGTRLNPDSVANIKIPQLQ
ncbi:hypothetical protein SSX86_020783 [Deinandra increscens subsp. villosa]|uniref:Bet v I/Major latex protein domain-containing protein n=1 Tax=Deinandra increscens subsp. villosa TaxID=3103831 RepID=A0AAP0CNM8_9ASTR